MGYIIFKLYIPFFYFINSKNKLWYFCRTLGNCVSFSGKLKASQSDIKNIVKYKLRFCLFFYLSNKDLKDWD